MMTYHSDHYMKRLTPNDHVENLFTTATPEVCAAMLEKIMLIMRVRAIPGPAPKLGRPRKKREKPPITATEAAV